MQMQLLMEADIKLSVIDSHQLTKTGPFSCSSSSTYHVNRSCAPTRIFCLTGLLLQKPCNQERCVSAMQSKLSMTLGCLKGIGLNAGGFAE